MLDIYIHLKNLCLIIINIIKKPFRECKNNILWFGLTDIREKEREREREYYKIRWHEMDNSYVHMLQLW